MRPRRPTTRRSGARDRSVSANADGPVWKTTPARNRSPRRSRIHSRCAASPRFGAAVALTSIATTRPTPNSARRSTSWRPFFSRTWKRRGRPALAARPELSGDEGVEQASEQVAIAEHTFEIDPQCRSDERRIGDVALRRLDQPSKPIREPGRNGVEHEEIRQQAFVGIRGLLVDVRRVIDRRPCSRSPPSSAQALEESGESRRVTAREADRVTLTVRVAVRRPWLPAATSSSIAASG